MLFLQRNAACPLLGVKRTSGGGVGNRLRRLAGYWLVFNKSK